MAKIASAKQKGRSLGRPFRFVLCELLREREPNLGRRGADFRVDGLLVLGEVLLGVPTSLQAVASNAFLSA